MNSSYVIGSVAVVTLVTVAVYAYGNSGSPASEVSPPTEIDSFVNPEYAVEAPPSTGAISAPAGGGTGAAGELAEFLGSMLASPGAVLGGITLVGQVADFANPGVRKNTEDVLKEAGLEKDLRDFQKRQDGYDMVSGRIEDHMITNSDNALRGAPPLVQDLGRGVAIGLGDLANAPVEVAAILDSSIMGQIGEFKAADTDLEKALVVIGARDAIISGIVFDGIGGGLADMIAKTPEERAKAQEVLDLINPSKQLDRLTGIVVPLLQDSLAETTARLAREKAERDAIAKARADDLAARQKVRNDAFQTSLKETADRLAREQKERDDALAASLKQTADRLAREKKERDDAFAASLRETADRLAREKAEREALAARLAAEQKARNEKAKEALQKIADVFDPEEAIKKRFQAQFGPQWRQMYSEDVKERNKTPAEKAADTVAYEKQMVVYHEKMAAEQKVRDDKVRSDLQKIADAFSRDKVEEGWNKIEDAFSQEKVEAGWKTTTDGITNFFNGNLFKR